MTAIQLLKKTQQDHTNSENLGLGEDISYLHKHTGTVDTTRAFVSNNIFNDLKTDIRTNEVLFSSILLTEEPKENDVITYNGLEYRVRLWEKQIDRYEIRAIQLRHHTQMRVKT
ncbi:MAG: hypothetical protein DRH04_02200 [Deltaproteobacteria bacterium]|nr:MAG: hypothetical protein DRH04_02200 [Deltaproteobacteria bacterium]